MDGIEKITARINAESNREIADINAQAQEKVQAIQEQYRAQAEQECGAILERGRKAAGERLERLNSAAGMERRKLELATKQQVLGEAFSLALDTLCGLPEGEYAALLADLAVQAARSGREQLIFSTADRARVGKQVVLAANEKLSKKGGAGALTLSQETRPIRGGFILSDGSVEINCAFETLVRMQREVLEKEVAAVLFEK